MVKVRGESEPVTLAPIEPVQPGQEMQHIDDVKYDKKGRVKRVHHVIWGWISPRSMYFLEKLHQLWPGANASMNSVIHGGYVFKSAIVGTAPEAFGFSFPLGVGLYAWAGIN